MFALYRTALSVAAASAEAAWHTLVRRHGSSLTRFELLLLLITGVVRNGEGKRRGGYPANERTTGCGPLLHAQDIVTRHRLRRVRIGHHLLVTRHRMADRVRVTLALVLILTLTLTQP